MGTTTALVLPRGLAEARGLGRGGQGWKPVSRVLQINHRPQELPDLGLRRGEVFATGAKLHGVQRHSVIKINYNLILEKLKSANCGPTGQLDHTSSIISVQGPPESHAKPHACKATLCLFGRERRGRAGQPRAERLPESP